MMIVVLAGLPAGAIAAQLPASAASNGSFAVAPLNAKTGHPRGLYAPVLPPGGTGSDKLSVANLTNSPMKLNLYAADAYNAATGSFTIQPDYKPKLHMGAWIHLAVPSVTIAPQSGYIVPFTYTVPANEPPGDYAGGIVAVQTTNNVAKTGPVRTRVLNAIGIPVLGTIPGPLHPRLAVTAVSIATKSTLATQFGGSVDATVTYSITNTGNQDLTPVITVSLSPFIGGAVKDQRRLHGALFPGSTVTFRHTFDNVQPYGALTANVTAHTAKASATGSSTAVIIPWGIVAIVVLLIVLIVWLVRRRRRRSRPGPPSEFAQSQGAPPGPAGGAGAPPVPPAPVGGGPGARGP
jgi:hypothetical protein